MLKGKKKALAAQVLLGLMVAGNAYTVDCGVASAEEYTVGWFEEGQFKDPATQFHTGWVDKVVLSADGDKCFTAASSDISGNEITVRVSGGASAIIKGHNITNNIVNIGNRYYTDSGKGSRWYYNGDNKVFDASGVCSGNIVNVYNLNLAGGSGIDAGDTTTLNLHGTSTELLNDGNNDVPTATASNPCTITAGEINVEASDADTILQTSGSAGLDLTAANTININASGFTANELKATDGNNGTIAINALGVEAAKTASQILIIGANNFTAENFKALGADGDSITAGMVKVTGNNVDLTGLDLYGGDVYKSFEVYGDNFKSVGIHSYKDHTSFFGDNAIINGNINMQCDNASLNIAGNNANINGDIAGNSGLNVNISGNNATITGDITTTGSGTIIVSGNGTTTGTLKTGTLEITGNGTLNASDVTNVGSIVVKSTATGKVFEATNGMSAGKLDAEASKTNETTALFSNDYAASYDDTHGYIKNTRTQSIREQSKSYVETQMAALAMVASGADLLANAGFTNAAQAVQDAKDSGDSGRSMVPYVAANYGSMRQESGSHVDVKGSNFNIGFAKEVKNGSGKLLFGPMFEYGRGNYDSYLDDGTTGSGTAQNYGIGMMARQTNDNGFYYEGSVRYGKVTSDYSSSNVWAGHDVSYDNSAKYWGAHVGVGKLQKLGGDNAIDLYGKLFYTNQGSSSVNINGDTLDFSSVKSKRSRIGFRYIHGTSDVRSVYAGLAWQYEFDGAAHATANGFSTPSPSVKGSSGMLELGVLIAPKASPVSFDLGVSGWAGKQKGYSLNANMLWSF
ncbi:MAG: autotransporter outer membrane beta-barrel domain-containing protein [Veillonellaceae bacterium]|nr:autotransporter outer membrane beta-barrel domain-containing protein [Veillonellaceae bacterium]